MSFGRWSAIVTSVAIASAWLFLAACESGRFPICKSSSECALRDGGAAAPVCFNLRCVECHYDDDCKPGFVCTESATCHDVSGVERDAGEVEFGDGGNTWEHGSWDQCAADCKEQECIHDCDLRFPKGAQ